MVHWIIQISKILTHFNIQGQKITFVNITTGFIGNIFKFEKLTSSPWQIQLFQNSNFLLKTQILSVTTNTSSYFTFEVTGKCQPKTQVWLTMVSQLFFKVRTVLHKKLVQLPIHTKTQVLSLKTVIVIPSADMHYANFLFCLSEY